MRLLFTFVGGEGHAAPLVPIARAAEGAGHEVALTGSPALVPLLEAAGLTAFPSGPGGRPGPGGITPLLAPDQAREERDLRERFTGDHADARAEAVADLCEAWRPDVVVSDETDFGGLVGAERAGRPRAVVQVTASGAFLRADALDGALDELRGRHGLGADPDLSMLQGDLCLVPFPPGFRAAEVPWPARGHALRPGLDGLGPPSAPPSWLPALGDRPMVWLSLGTVFNAESGDLFDRAVAGLAALDVDLVVTVGRQLDPDALGSRPGRVHIARYLPQAELLPHTDLVVSHGGSGSVMGALAFGRPLVLLPMGADQLLNADRCAALGLGPVLDVVGATAAEIGEAAIATLGDPGAAAAVAALQAEIDALPGPERAVALLDELGG